MGCETPSALLSGLALVDSPLMRGVVNAAPYRAYETPSVLS